MAPRLKPVAARPSLKRPHPPEHLLEPTASGVFVPAPDLTEWLRATFINDDAALVNDDHRHLRYATLGCLWTNVPNSRQGRTIVGQCEFMPPHVMGKWQKARALQQIVEWFGHVPDFVFTFDAPYALRCDDASFCALCEHEQYHAGQEHNEFGAPKFKQDGSPCFAIRGHDVEEFIGVVRRYGAQASNAAQLIAAAQKPPEVSLGRIAGACGTCLKMAA